ncbi:hypothetical protein FB645_005021 [Coemansia sp. IMI 203386]|nr:hypothetical protein FB645_005021 [Coemansia sp. IMI 203386]
MNQNPFASFFSPETGAYPQLPDPLVANGYMDARTGLMIKDDSLHTSTLSHDSHDSDSSPSTPSKSKKSEQHRTPKSKAEVSERMRRWRSENAEKNRLNDLRCRVYRQARIRFGKDPTPEREAWIQSEIFRRLERRRLREAMKGNGSVPAPTAMTSPTSMAMGIGHPAGGPITRSRSTVHPFPIHMNGQGNVPPDHAMNFPATPYAMMAGAAGIYDSGQQSYGPNGSHCHGSHNQQHNQHMGHPQMGLSHHNNGYMAHSQGYGGSQSQQHQHQQQQQHSQYGHQSQMQAPGQHQGDQLASNFINGASNALPSTDLYSPFKFINPLYPGRILPHQTNGSLGSTHPGVQSFYGSQQQQQQTSNAHNQSQGHYMNHHQQQQQHTSQQQHSSHSHHNQMNQHTVPSNQPSQPHATNSVDAATAAAVAAVADFSTSFQLPQNSSQAMYSYYQESAAPAWETSVSSAEISHNGHQTTTSSPATPAETLGSQQPSQYTLHAVDHSMYSTIVSDTQQGTQTSVPSISSLNMVDPIAHSNIGSLDNNEADDRGANVAGNLEAASSGNGSYSTASDLTAVAAASVQPSSSANYLYGYGGQPASPSLNDVASNLFSLRQISQANSTGGDSAVDVKTQQQQMSAGSEHVSVSREAEMPVGESATHLSADHVVNKGINVDHRDARESDHLNAEPDAQNQSLVQVAFNLNAVPDSIQF